MCGLWGVSSTGEVDLTDLGRLQDLAILSELRGVHSAGLFAVYESQKQIHITHEKAAVTASQLLSRSQKLPPLFKDEKVYLIAGHSRHATVGKINAENAHPFISGDIIGMHNGTVKDYVPEDSEITDSEKIIQDIDKNGLKQTLKDISNGAYALVFADKKTGTVNFIRNKERTLFFFDAGMGVTYWSSEYGMLEYMAERNFLTTRKSYIKAFEVGYHYVLDLYTGKMEKKELLVEEPKPAPVFTSYQGYQSALTKEEHKPKTSVPVVLPHKKPEVQNKPTIKLSKKQRRKLRMEENKKKAAQKITQTKVQEYEGFRNQRMTVEEAKRLLQKGCAIHGDIYDIEETVYWISPNDYVGESTVRQGHLQSYGITEAYAGKLIGASA